ncbi:agmatinase [Saccharopolyspora terrae]|uniref:Agmatinase n=1 Tax=Saccharopolyspora terrae TaxID=2530384 RepID=A0A4R4VLW9_9PSEU|nr:agmatinase [Saccharopolyspora terrae]
MGDVVGPVDTTRVPRTAIPATFAGLPRVDEVSQIDAGVVGIPFDTTVSYRPGARFGPNHIRASSRLLRPYNPEADAWPFATQQVADFGDMPAHPFDIPEAVDQIERGARDALERSKRLLVLGGDHSIALPVLRAIHAHHGSVAVVHFDAHLDTWEGTFNTPVQHGTPFRRASEEGLLDLEACMHIGTRGGLYGAADMDDDRALGFAVSRCEELDLTGVRGVIERLRSRVGERPVYVSVDIDVLDPAFAPGTGTPESGGLTSRELLTMLRATAGLNVVGADIVEVSPAYDHAEITGIAAAHVGYELLSSWAPALQGDAAAIRTR